MVSGEICAARPERDNRCHEISLNAQKSAEAIVPEKGRVESVGVHSTTAKGGMRAGMQKTSAMAAAHKEIVRNTRKKAPDECLCDLRPVRER